MALPLTGVTNTDVERLFSIRYLSSRKRKWGPDNTGAGKLLLSGNVVTLRSSQVGIMGIQQGRRFRGAVLTEERNRPDIYAKAFLMGCQASTSSLRDRGAGEEL